MSLMTRAAALLAVAACFAPNALAGGMPRAMLERAQAAGIPGDAIAFVVRRAGDGAVVASARAGVPMPPASTLKVLTSIAALETLGPTWRGSTELLATGDVRQGVLHGDLILRGRGDVDLDAAALERMLRRLRTAGVREIRGDLVLDRTWFLPARMDIGLPPFDESPEFRYNVIPDALMLGSNLIDVELFSDSRGVHAMAPAAFGDVTFRSAMALVEAPCDDWEDLWRIPAVEERGRGVRITLHGQFPKSCAASTAINVFDRTRYAAMLFGQQWRALGGRWRGKAREAQSPVAAGTLVARHVSRPMNELVRDIDKRSDNPIARMAYLAMGAESAEGAGEPTTVRAERAVRRWLAAHALDDRGLVLENGSGLSRSERISPELLAGVLQAALASPWSAEILASLPIVGIDGGMRNRAADGPARATSRIKTGTLRDVSAIAGYVQGDQRYIVVAMIHHDLAVKHAARPVLDALVDWVARGMPAD